MMIFVLLLNMTPSFDSLTNFYMTDVLKFSSTTLANFSTLASLCYLMSLVLYYYCFKQVNPKKVFITTNFLYLFFNISFLLVVFGLIEKWGMNNTYFCMFSSGIQSFITEMNFLPLLAIWCAICPKDLEATSITLFTGLINMAGSFSCYFGSLVEIIMSVDENNLEKIWLPLIIQNLYLLAMTVYIVFVEFPVIEG